MKTSQSKTKKKVLIEVKNITKTFTDGPVATHVLKGIDLEIYEGEFVAIMGRSGAGKSTLLYQMSLLDNPTGGSITLNGHNVDRLNNEERTRFRLTELGYVFQDYSLLPELSAVENIMIPLLMQGISVRVAKDRALKALESVNLFARADNLPSELSGGEQQRVSIARAITHKPRILFADEPTANLDSFSSNLVMDIFKKLNKEEGLTIVMVTHEEDYGKMADRIVKLHDGVVVK
jgi:putative ABC transport system ATP-binding protein